MRSPQVSIALASYNGARFLGAQLESIAAQTLPPHEIVIGDDGSSDRTAEIVAAFARSAPFPVAFHRNEERLGYRRNFMAAAGRCSGEIVFFCDQDDVWQAGKVERLSAMLEARGALLAYHNATVADVRADPLRPLYDDVAERSKIAAPFPDPFHFPLGFTQAFKRDLGRFDDLWPLSKDPFMRDAPLAHDQWFFFLATILGHVAYTEEQLALYRQHDGNVFGASSARISNARWHDRFFEAADPDGARAVAAHTRSIIAREVARRVDESQRRHALRFADRYERLAEWLFNWTRTGAAPTRAQRVAAWTANIRAGAYTSADPWHLRKASVVGDAIRVLGRPSGDRAEDGR